MPKRPQVTPAPGDREVWVDPMPDQDEEKDWLLAFGEVDDAFRITDPETGEAGDRGYVRFVDHVAAERCVESGAAEWSESERVLMSQSSRGSTSVYRESVIALILGPRGETINKVKDSIGASMLALRGDGLNGNSSTKSDRLHFVCKGTGEVVSKLQPALEEMMASIHVQIVERLADTTDRTFASGSEAGPAPKTRRGGATCREGKTSAPLPPPPLPPPMPMPPPPGAWFAGPGVPWPAVPRPTPSSSWGGGALPSCGPSQAAHLRGRSRPSSSVSAGAFGPCGQPSAVGAHSGTDRALPLTAKSTSPAGPSSRQAEATAAPSGKRRKVFVPKHLRSQAGEEIEL